MDRTKQLGEESIVKLLFKFSMPAIVGMLVNAMYSIVDRIFVGHWVGSLALAGVAITYPLTNIIMAFGMLVGVGAGALCSIRLGQKRKEEAEKILGNAFSLTILVSILITVLGLIFQNQLLILFGASKEIMGYAKTFSTILLCGIILQNIGFGLNNLIRSEGNPKIAMYTMLIGAILNTILNPIFIVIFHLGVAGSAFATICSQSVCTVWILSYFTGGKSLLRLKKSNMTLKPQRIKEIFAIGMSPFAMQLAASIVTIILNKSLRIYGGDLAIAAMALINSFTMLILMPIFGINQGSQPIIGYNYGAKNPERVEKALKLAVLSATSIVVVGAFFVQFFPEQIMSIFSSDKKLIAIGSHGMKIYLFMIPIIGFQIVSSNYFEAIGKAKISMFLSLSRQVLVLIPLLLILPKTFGLNGVWLAGPSSDFTASILTAIFIYKDIKSLKTTLA